MNNLNNLSEQLLLAVKNEEAHDSVLTTLAAYDATEIEKQLHNDRCKNAFWINIYNSFFQILRKHRHLGPPKIYTAKEMIIAGHRISLDDIEHGVLRRYRYKYSLGYFSNPFASALIKKWAVSKIDFRIHFALNCGAKSCPPIAFYNVDQLEEQLKLSTKSFLEDETQINEQQKKAHVSKLFLWFLNDFGGKKGIREIISSYLDQDLSNYKLVYKPYSWDEHLDNYAQNRF